VEEFRAVDPTRAPGRRYRRRRHGEPVNPEWTAPPGAAGSPADAPPLDNPLAALGRSRQLIRGHGWGVFGRLVALGLMEGVASTVLRAVFSWLPAAWQLGLENGVLYILFIPAGAVLSTMIYYRLTAARAAALPN
jgi:hypothetical protein